MILVTHQIMLLERHTPFPPLNDGQHCLIYQEPGNLQNPQTLQEGQYLPTIMYINHIGVGTFAPNSSF